MGSRAPYVLEGPNVDHISIESLRQLIANRRPNIHKLTEPVTEWTVAGEGSYAALGRQLMAQGACACILVAGGQGTRLGFPGPKGLFPVSVIKGKSLFQRICERVLFAGRQVGAKLSIAIMTSQENDRETREYFADQQYFGLETQQIEFFVQGSLPMLNREGEPFDDNYGKPAEGADGNGSVFGHFARSGIAQRWKEKGIRVVSFIQVDNALADPFDAELLGFHSDSHVDVTIKAIWRDDPMEKVGVIVRASEKTQVVEYSEIDEGERTRRDSDGELVHRLANLSQFCFSLDFMEHVAQEELPLHIAIKTVNAKQGQCQAYKFEYFVFDCLELARKTAILVMPRQRCFAALKNRDGPDSLTTVQSDLLAFDRAVYKALTGHSPDPEAPLELSAEFYYPTPAFEAALKNGHWPSAGYIDSSCKRGYSAPSEGVR